MCDDEKTTHQSGVRPEKPQTLTGIAATKSLNPAETDDKPETSGNASLRQRARTQTIEQSETECRGAGSEAVIGSEGDNGGDTLSGAGEEHSTVVGLRRESQHYEDTSPSSQALQKALFGRSLRNPSSVGAGGVAPVTRKCVLTLDGYSYVIVASTPESLPKRDESSSNSAVSGSSNTNSNNSSVATTSSASSERYQQQLQQQQQQQRAPGASGPNSSGVGGGGAGTATATGSGGERSKTNSPTTDYNNSAANSTLNGQVAKHGSLTIVRRSNSRKSFSQLEQQQQQTILISPSATTATGAGNTDNWSNNLTYSIAATKTTAVATQSLTDNRTKFTSGQELPQEKLHDNAQFQQLQQKFDTVTSSSSSPAVFTTQTITIRKTLSRGDSQQQQQQQQQSLQTTADLHMNFENACPPSSPNPTNFTTHTVAADSVTTSADFEAGAPSPVSPHRILNKKDNLPKAPASFKPGTPHTTPIRPFRQSIRAARQSSVHKEMDTTGSSETSSTQSPKDAGGVNVSASNSAVSTSPSVSIEWSTENLPAVDTVDALDKAAARLRNLLHQLTAGDISHDDLQKNLHYAARVLEAVFLDETRRPLPTTLKLKTGRRSSSAVADEEDDEDDKTRPSAEQQCNGSCKNVECNQTSNTRTAESGTSDDATTTSTTTLKEAETQPSNDTNNSRSSSSSCALQKPEDADKTQSLEDNQSLDSIDSRTKGVTSEPQTHSGPTGPPSATSEETSTKTETTTTSTESEQPAGNPTKAPSEREPTTATTSTDSPANDNGNNSSSSCSNKATMQRQRRLRTPVWARSMSTSLAASTTSSLPPTTANKTCHAKENHGQAIFGITFNHWLAPVGQPLIFATAGSNRCTVYECPREGGLKMLMVYADPDPDEIFYTCAWSYELKTGSPLLATAGYRGVIRVIDVVSNQTVGNYIGHGQAINELKYHYQKPHLLLSASKDHAIRLWNTQSHVCIAIFGGVEGHRDEVLSIDFDIRGARIMSCGMDHSLKLWCIDKPDFKEKIELSDTFNANKSQVPFPTIMQHFPDYSTRDIHRNYVDCVQWFENYVLSKSCENSIVCWKPGQLQQPYFELKPNDSRSTIITEFAYNECEMWFIRFGFNPWQHILALGNQHGKVFVWELDPNEPRHSHACVLSNHRCNSIVRQIAFSRDASVLVYICDDGTVWRWNRANSVQK